MWSHTLEGNRPRSGRSLNPPVGRGPVLEAIASHLSAGARLVTLTGPGGIGRTRVAEAFAEQQRMPVVRLGPLDDPALIAAETAAQLGAVRLSGEDPEFSIARLIAGGASTIVLDDRSPMGFDRSARRRRG